MIRAAGSRRPASHIVSLHGHRRIELALNPCRRLIAVRSLCVIDQGRRAAKLSPALRQRVVQGRNLAATGKVERVGREIGTAIVEHLKRGISRVDERGVRVSIRNAGEVEAPASPKHGLVAERVRRRPPRTEIGQLLRLLLVNSGKLRQ